MDKFLGTQTIYSPGLLLAAGKDRFGQHWGLGISDLTFKVTSQDSDGFFILENPFREPGR